MAQEPQSLEARFERTLRTAGLLGAPLAAIAIYAAHPGGLPPEGRRLLAIATLTIVWWMTEAIPLPAAALVSSALAIAAGVAPARQVLAPYADPVIFLFLGSFLLAEGVSRFDLDRRFAAALLRWRVFGRGPAGRLTAFGAASATLSSCLSNTATTALFTPIALGALGKPAGGRPRRIDSALLLMVAYGASIGGMATLIGTPPNLLVAGFLERLAGVKIGFTGWLVFGVPIAAALLLVSLALLRLTLLRGLAGESTGPLALEDPRTAPGDDERRRGARWTVLAFSLAFLLWLSPSLAQGLLGRAHPLTAGLERHLPEAGVALLCASLLFLAPLDWRRRRFVLSWADGERVNWGVLILFGGGLSLGTLAEATGVARWAGEAIVRFASNTACATLLLPVVIAGAKQAGFDPVAPALGAGLACSCAFVFPVSTPGNAIVFGTGRVPLTRMIRAGALIDFVAVFVLWAGVLLLRPWLPR
jgi:sodium-dependent dicarboxylate transporter 2/3/5